MRPPRIARRFQKGRCAFCDVAAVAVLAIWEDSVTCAFDTFDTFVIDTGTHVDHRAQRPTYRAAPNRPRDASIFGKADAEHHDSIKHSAPCVFVIRKTVGLVPAGPQLSTTLQIITEGR